MSYSHNIAKNLRAARHRLGFTQAEVAELAGVPRTTIANFESGHANPTVGLLLQVSRAIDATLDYLTSDNGETVDIGESKVDETNAVVYFVMMGNPSTVKIGKASDLQKRMRDFRLHGGIEPTVLFTLPGYTQLESEMHHRFDRYRYAGEWFRVEGALAEFINERVSEKKRQRDAIMKKCLGVLFEPDEAMH